MKTDGVIGRLWFRSFESALYCIGAEGPRPIGILIQIPPGLFDVTAQYTPGFGILSLTRADGPQL